MGPPRGMQRLREKGEVRFCFGEGEEGGLSGR